MRLEQVRGTFFQTRGGEPLSANAGGSFMNHPKEFAEGLSIGIINLINILQPEIICLGGGISNAEDDLLLDPLRQLVSMSLV